MPPTRTRDTKGQNMLLHRLIRLAVATLVVVDVATAFRSPPPHHTITNNNNNNHALLRAASIDDNDDKLNLEDAFDLERFQRRQQAIQESKQPLPPHPELQPQQVVETLLNTLRELPQYYEYDNTRPHPGVETLWHASTPQWKQTMAAIVGLAAANSSTATTSTIMLDDEEQILIPALGRFLARPNQQFAILLGVEDSNYWIDFPTDVIEWSDEEAWLECRLRDSANDELLVVLGWTLTRDDDEASWYIHSFDWQDFRNAYRPGIGREEWERICG